MRDLSMQDVLAVPRHWFHAASRPETGNRLRVPRCRSLPPPPWCVAFGQLAKSSAACRGRVRVGGLAFYPAAAVRGWEWEAEGRRKREVTAKCSAVPLRSLSVNQWLDAAGDEEQRASSRDQRPSVLDLPRHSATARSMRPWRDASQHHWWKQGSPARPCSLQLQGARVQGTRRRPLRGLKSGGSIPTRRGAQAAQAPRQSPCTVL